MNSLKKIETNSCLLHVLAMTFMFCDHLWAEYLPMYRWLTCVGRIAFPIFAFMTVEGYFRTSNLKKYLLRMLAFALISEIPFNLMYSGNPFYLFHQNVIWTLMLGLLVIHAIEMLRTKGKWWITVPVGLVIVIAAYLLSNVAMLDYAMFGMLTMMTFYLFRGRKWWCFLGQFLCMYYINVELMGGFYYPIELFGHAFELQEQSLALLALIPIWLYRGKQGYHAKWFQYFCYAFYPAHMLFLYILYKLG